MDLRRSHLCLFLATFLILSPLSLSSDPCDPSSQWDPRTLRSDQLTVLLNGYASARVPLLRSIAADYSALPIVAAVLVLWGDPSTPTQTLAALARNLSLSSLGTAPIRLVPQPSRSLNRRFLPRAEIRTRAVLVADDDVEVDRSSVAFAFRVWAGQPDRLIGFFARSHDLDLARKEWIYTVHPDKYSIVLTKLMIMKSDYLFRYSCSGGAEMARARRVVDEARNCEDILMNFVAAEAVGAGPVLVGARRARDWGDARNDGGDGNGRRRLGGEVAKVGLSSRRSEHRKRRGVCIREFHRALGRMSLRYSYGKVVNSVGEQGLCRKGRKLVYCDRN